VTIRKGRRIAFASAALLALIVAAGFALFQISKAGCWSLVGEAICRVETDERLIALTFDDGPTAEGVGWASGVLRHYGAHGTFFLIGGAVEGKEGLVRRLLADGHEVGNHSYSHVRMVLHRSAFYDNEIARTDALLRAAGVPAPTLFRPPYGKKLTGLPRALDRRHYRMILWDVEDPPGARNARDYADRVLREVRPGSIVLMHVMYKSNRTAREALPLIVLGLSARGYRLVTVSELLRHRRG
jgi:peptidoglycan/xylan/chitin deacetylase (PgdA/CDA1 family)